MEIACVTLDCHEPRRLAEFWSAALGWHDVVLGTDGASATCSGAEGGICLEFIRVPEAKSTKNRVHLGCSAGALHDLGPELERIVALGASIAWEEDFAPAVARQYRNVVLRDPEGNEFCLGGGTPPA
jgi:hypothetical protein